MNDEIKEIDITKDLYLCSPLLNKKCPKTSCYINNGSCCHTVNKEYSQEHLLDYITNLQQENQELNDSITWWKNRFNAVQRDYEDYKSKTEKAVEYIEKNLLPSHSIEKTDWEFEEVIFSDLPVEAIKPLIDILNGRSDE